MEMTQGVGSEKTKGRITAKYTNPTGEQEVKVMGPESEKTTEAHSEGKKK